MKMLIRKEEVCAFCQKTALEDEHYAEAKFILAGILDYIKDGMNISNNHITRF